MNDERHLDTVELKYPINLMGAEDGAENGDVVTRDGEFLGTWLCLNLCGGGAAFLPSTVLARLGRTWRV